MLRTVDDAHIEEVIQAVTVRRSLGLRADILRQRLLDRADDVVLDLVHVLEVLEAPDGLALEAGDQDERRADDRQQREAQRGGFDRPDRR